MPILVYSEIIGKQQEEEWLKYTHTNFPWPVFYWNRVRNWPEPNFHVLKDHTAFYSRVQGLL